MASLSFIDIVDFSRIIRMMLSICSGFLYRVIWDAACDKQTMSNVTMIGAFTMRLCPRVYLIGRWIVQALI